MVERIQALVAAHSTTIAEVEREVGLANGSIRRWDNSIPSADKLGIVADFFRVSVDYLLGRTDDPTPPMGASGDDEPLPEDLQFAFWGDVKELQPEHRETLRIMAKALREQQEKKNASLKK
ncbi:hypothetical protein FACS189425_05520 [Clostridia bacterium]|nr:hypothetical protein FACS189425_05520 [Clostridia bacterium]